MCMCALKDGLSVVERPCETTLCRSVRSVNNHVHAEDLPCLCSESLHHVQCSCGGAWQPTLHEPALAASACPAPNCITLSGTATACHDSHQMTFRHGRVRPILLQCICFSFGLLQ